MLRPSIVSTFRGSVILAVLLAGTAFFTPAAAQTPPSIDGDLDDMLQFAAEVEAAGTGCAIVIDDPSQDVAVIDNQIVPCVPIVDNYYENGFDQIKAVIVLFQGDLYLGIRTAGVIGDPDGNGDCDTSCPTTNVVEQPRIGSADAYQWFLDTNCGPSFAPNVTVTVQSNQVFVSGLTTLSEIHESQPGGNDLEVRLTGVELNGNPLLPLFKGRSFAGNTFDGLGEDLSVVGVCPPPDLNLTVEKTADPAEICPGGITTFSIQVTNPSLVPLDVVLEDELPAGFTYVGGTTVGLGEPGVAGSLLTFPDFTLEPGASILVSFDAQSPEECSGLVTNLARVTGSFSSPCVEGGEILTVGPITDTADVECVAPSVELVVGNVTACVGSLANLPIQVTNTSSASGDVVLVSVPGGQQTLINMGPGETRDVFVPLGCETPGQTPVAVTATLTLDRFEGCTAQDTGEGLLTCVQAGISLSAQGAEVCAGTEATVVLTVTSTSASVQDVTIEWTLGGAAQTPVQIQDLAPGATQDVNVPYTCEGSGTTAFAFEATAAVDGFPDCVAGDEAGAEVVCHEALVSITVGDAAACVGAAAQVPVTVTNLSAESANLSVTGTAGAAPVEQLFNNVEAGGVREFTVPVECGETGEVAVSLTAVAALVSFPDCTAEAADDGVATCAQAAVALDAVGDVVCVGTEGTVQLTVTNTSAGVEDITVDWSLNGAAQTPVVIQDLPAGESEIIPVPYSCTEPGTASFSFEATATLESNPDCQAQAEAAAVVVCREPAVSITAQDAASCVGQEAQVPVSVTNTGTEAENVVVQWTVGGAEQTPVDLGALEPGQTVDFDAPVSCAEAGQVALTFTALASFADLEGCERTAEAAATVTCRQALVAITVGDASACVGSPAQVPVTVTNNSSEAADLTVACEVGGGTVTESFDDVPAGESRQFNVEVPCEATGEVPVTSTVTATLVSDPDCTAEASDDGLATCGQALVSVVVPDTTICAGQEIELPVTVTNGSAEAANISVECIVGESSETLNFTAVPAGESRDFTVPVSCSETGPVVVTCTATSSLVRDENCGAEASDAGTVTCVAACIEAVATGAEVCVGDTATVMLDLRNCSEGTELVTVTCNVPGYPPVVQELEIGAGQSLQIPVYVPCTEPGTMEVICDVVAVLAGDAGCSAEARTTAQVTCLAPAVEITKTTDPQSTQDDSKVTLVVTNTGPTRLDPVTVQDHWPAGLTFDEASLTSDCGVSASTMSTGTATWVTFSDFALDPGQSCTIMFDLDCAEFDGAARVDTAIVVAWCDGVDSTDPEKQIYAVRDTAYAPILCEGGAACPRTIGFWRQQCAQKSGGSTKVCEEGMMDLWRCVIERSGVNRFKRNDGSWETRSELAALSDAELFAHMCEQLEGPRRMTHRDMAELQYLGLMLNLCSGNIAGSTPLSGSAGFSGTVAEAVAAIENSLNTEADINRWKDVSDAINNRQGVMAPTCEDENAIYRNLPACAQGTGELQPSGAPAYTGDTVLLRAQPNPAINTGTRIWFGVPDAQTGSAVELKIYDVAGRVVKTLLEGTPGAGLHQTGWNLTDDYGSNVPAGIYFYRLKVGSQELSERVFVRR